MIFTGNHNRRRAAQNGQTSSQRRKSSNFDASFIVNLTEKKKN